MTRPIISKAQLIKAAGAACFETAEKELTNVKIKDFHYTPERISAHVNQYATQVRYRGEQVEGECNCADSDGFDFCKHCVQLTLHANKVSQQLTSLAKGPDKSKVLAYLINQDKQELAKQFLNLLEDNPEQFQRYLLKASIDQKGIDYTELKSQLTQLTRLKEKLFSQRQVKHFFARIEQVLDELLHIPKEGHEDRLLKLVEYGFQRMNKLLDELEDRANQKQLIIEKLNTLYRSLFPHLSGRPETLAKRLFTLWLSDRHQLLAQPDTLNLKLETLKAFQTLAKQSWSDEGRDKFTHQKLSHYLKEQAEQEGHLEEAQLYRIALANTSDDWIKIAQIWLQNHQVDKAISILESQLHQADNKSRFIAPLLSAYEQLDNPLDSLKDLFSYQPIDVADSLFKQAKHDAGLAELQDFAIHILEKRAMPSEQNLFIELLIQRQQLDQAIQIAGQHQIDTEHLITLARALKATRPENSLQIYELALRQLLEQQRSKHDRLAAELLVEIESSLDAKINLNPLLDKLQPLFRLRPNVIKLARNLQYSS